MKLYDCQTAPNPRRVRIFLAEKGITVPVEQIDLAGRQNYTAEFRAKNPQGRVPVLELDDGTCIAESVAICRYFEELHPDPPLMGTDAKDRALVEMWQRRMELELFRPIALVFVHTHDYFKGRTEQVPEFGEVCRRQSLASLAWLDEILADRPFVAGERYTIADITALCGVDWGRVSAIRPDPPARPRGHQGSPGSARTSQPPARRWR
jgi:glutathione S-transferase